jgi:hypothetical protein
VRFGAAIACLRTCQFGAFDVPVGSWVVESASVFHPDYIWHDLARTWQTPGLGEEWMTAFLAGDPDGPGSARARTDRLEGLGHWWMPEDPAASAAVLRTFWASLES